VADKKFISLEAETLHEMKDNLKNDIKDILELLKVEKPKKITLITADDWKYNLFSVLEANKPFKNFGDIMREVMKDDELRKKGKETTSVAEKVFKKPSRMPKKTVSKKDEENALNEFKAQCTEFGCKIEILNEKTCKHEKGKDALPCKPAIVIEK